MKIKGGIQLNLNHEQVINIIKNALNEDIGTGDITTDTLIPDSHWSEAYITAKEEGVIAGLPIVQTVFELVDTHIRFEYLKQDGEQVTYGEHLAMITGSTASILKGERLALNLLQRLSGIATKTAHLKDLVKDYPVRIVDTRKTTPGLRILEKYAVKIGGGDNHRMGLYDAVMIKDNHIQAVGSISDAILKAKKAIPHTMKVEVEVEDLAGVKEAVDAGADIIMLDNMPPEVMRKAVELIDGRAITEASGNITADNIQAAAASGIDVISMGTLTHTIRSMDISLNISPKKIEELESRH